MITHPAYGRPIRETRCLVPVDYFICLATDGQPHLIYSMESRPFALAGIFNTWKADMKLKDLYHGFALLTCPAPPAFQEVGIERMPVVLEMRLYKKWINPETPLLKVTKYVDPPEENFLNGFPVNKSLVETREDSREICRPAGPEIIPIKNTDFGKIGAYLKSFLYKRGVTHKPPNEDRIWRQYSSTEGDSNKIFSIGLNLYSVVKFFRLLPFFLRLLFAPLGFYPQLFVD